jgi:hypothetical protein
MMGMRRLTRRMPTEKCSGLELPNELFHPRAEEIKLDKTLGMLISGGFNL